MIPESFRRMSAGQRAREIFGWIGVALAILLVALAAIAGGPKCPPGSQEIKGWQGGRMVHLCMQESKP